MSFTKTVGRGGPPLHMRWRGTALGALLLGTGFGLGAPSAYAQAVCARTLTADVVAIDMPIVNNRLGASNVNGMMYALRDDIRSISATDLDITATITDPVTGVQRRNAKLRDDKRPRPLVLRVAAGDCLDVNFQNLVAPVPNPLNAPLDRDGFWRCDANGNPITVNDPNPVTADGLPQINVFVDEQVLERRVGFHAAGMQLRALGGIANDGSFVGKNASSLMAPGQSTTYSLYAEKEQVYQVINTGALVGSDANQGNTANGLFGQIIVEPKGAKMYRNTVTEEELRLATRTARGTSLTCPRLDGVVPGSTGTPALRYCQTLAGHPVLNYEATYPNTGPVEPGRQGRPHGAEHDPGQPDRAHRTGCRDRRPQCRRQLPGQHLPAGSHRQAQPRLPQPPGAVPRLRAGVA